MALLKRSQPLTQSASTGPFSRDINEHIKWRQKGDGYTGDPYIYTFTHSDTFTHTHTQSYTHSHTRTSTDMVTLTRLMRWELICESDRATFVKSDSQLRQPWLRDNSLPVRVCVQYMGEHVHVCVCVCLSTWNPRVNTGFLFSSICSISSFLRY